MEYGIVKCIEFIKDCVLSIIYCDDGKCILCGNDIYSDEFICHCCSKKIMPCRDVIEIKSGDIKFYCYSAAYYSGPMVELVIKLKYKSSFRAGRVIADYMYDVIKRNNLEFDIITYIPMLGKDLRKRGYNQGKYIAKILNKYTEKPVVSCLIKTRATKDQIGLNKIDRWKNIKGSFKIIDRKLVENKNILLVDDVITTGATAFHSALELKKCGAKNIIILTGAKSEV
ncbi:ComF family protein [Clostridium sp.]|jgi:competence protein ComFC|uniref:ComF family protein n=1 Tax=Clostridium sp. TaxID=1506 RepID=UPI003A5BB740